MAHSLSRRLPAAAIAAVTLSLAVPSAIHAHNGIVHGEMQDASQDSSQPPSEATAPTSTPAEPSSALTPSRISGESLVPQPSSAAPPLLQRSSLIAASLWREHHLQEGEFICALILAAPFGLIFLKRRIQANTALTRKVAQ